MLNRVGAKGYREGRVTKCHLCKTASVFTAKASPHESQILEGLRQEVWKKEALPLVKEETLWVSCLPNWLEII